MRFQESIESQAFEIAKVEDDNGCGAVVLSITLSSAGEEDIAVTHRLATRQAVEEAITGLREAADTLWPVS